MVQFYIRGFRSDLTSSCWDCSTNKTSISHRPWAMLLWQAYINSQWLIAVFPPMLYFTYDFMPLYLDKNRGQYIVKDWYPNAVTSIWVPSTMNAVMQSLRRKEIGCHCCHHILLQNAGAIALKLGALTFWDHFCWDILALMEFPDATCDRCDRCNMCDKCNTCD